MTDTMSMDTETNGLSRRRMTRVLAVGAAVLISLAVWALAEFTFGIALEEQSAPGSGSPDLVNPVSVIVASAVGSLAGWALLAVLERFTASAMTVWTVVAVAVTVLSLGGPLTSPGITGEGRVVLSLIHLLVGGAVITIFRRTSRRPVTELGNSSS